MTIKAKFLACWLLFILMRLAVTNDRMLTFETVQYNGGRGKAVNCGPGNFSLEWEPKNIYLRGEVTLYVDMISDIEFDGGFEQVNISIHGDQKPIYRDNATLTCKDINKIAPASCPIFRKERLKGSKYIKDLSRLRPGTFEISARITNTQHQLLLCFKLTLTLME